MKYYEISYYRSRNWIDKKYIKSELGPYGTINRMKTVTDVQEITEAEYKSALERKKSLAKAKAQEREAGFIVT